MDTKGLAIAYIKSLDAEGRIRTKEMMSHGVKCGMGYAERNGVDGNEFNEELKAILEDR